MKKPININIWHTIYMLVVEILEVDASVTLEEIELSIVDATKDVMVTIEEDN